MDSFLVNLADTDSSRYLRVTLRLVVPSPKEAEEVGKDEVRKVQLRSAVLELLAQQQSTRLLTADGKEELKAAIGKRASQVLGTKEVIDVLFTDFVVQL
jgi:flagellar protein FliL